MVKCLKIFENEKDILKIRFHLFRECIFVPSEL